MVRRIRTKGAKPIAAYAHRVVFSFAAAGDQFEAEPLRNSRRAIFVSAHSIFGFAACVSISDLDSGPKSVALDLDLRRGFLLDQFVSNDSRLERSISTRIRVEE